MHQKAGSGSIPLDELCFTSTAKLGNGPARHCRDSIATHRRLHGGAPCRVVLCYVCNITAQAGVVLQAGPRRGTPAADASVAQDGGGHPCPTDLVGSSHARCCRSISAVAAWCLRGFLLPGFPFCHRGLIYNPRPMATSSENPCRTRAPHRRKVITWQHAGGPGLGCDDEQCGKRYRIAAREFQRKLRLRW